MLRALHLLFLFALAAADPVSYEDCGSQYTLLKVDLEGCSDVPCVLNTGTYTNVTIDFQSNSRSDSLRAVVRITLLGVENNALTTPTKPCDGLTSSSCPVLQGQVHEYRGQVYADPKFIPVKGLLTWKLLNEINVVVVCFKVDIRIHEEDPLKLDHRSRQVRSAANRKARKSRSKKARGESRRRRGPQALRRGSRKDERPQKLHKKQ